MGGGDLSHYLKNFLVCLDDVAFVGIPRTFRMKRDIFYVSNETDFSWAKPE